MGFHVFGNGTDTVGWQPTPQKRGTFDILTTCTITLLLCVWSAIHPNVPRRASFREIFLGRFKMLALALVMPEVLVFLAWSQRLAAYDIMAEVNEALDLPKWSFRSRFREPKKMCDTEQQRSQLDKKTKCDRSPWTPTHGFFVLMGGLGYKVPENLPDGYEFRHRPREEQWTVSIEGIRLLLEDETSKSAIPDISREDIKDKSKASGWVKLFICVQVIWFCTQAITRLAQGLAISLLELNTFGHCVCALLIYILWWDKPQDVEQRSNLSSVRLLGCRALREMFKSTPNVTRTREYMKELFPKQDFPLLNLQIDNSPQEFPNREIQLVEIAHPEPPLDDVEPDYDTKGTFIKMRLEPGEFLPGTGLHLPQEPINPHDVSDSTERLWFLDDPLKQTFSYEEHKENWVLERPRSGLPLPTALDLYTSDVIRWRLAWKAIYPLASKTKQLHRPVHALVEYSPDVRTLPHNSDWGWSMFLLSGALYGGLHAVAWNASFATETEQLLWRISTCAIMCSGLILLPILYFSPVEPAGFLWRTIAATVGLITLFYMAARVYLIIECFITLANLPASAYDLPNWSVYAPHVT